MKKSQFILLSLGLLGWSLVAQAESRTHLPSKSDLGMPGEWQQRDLSLILGGIINKEGQADVAIFESPGSQVPAGTISRESLLAATPAGRVTYVKFKGEQLKRIVSLINKNAFDIPLTAVGIDAAGRKIRGRSIRDNEEFTVALSEKALLQMMDLATMGGLNRIFLIRAPFAADVLADYKGLNYLKGPSPITLTDTTNELSVAVANLSKAPPVKNLVDQYFNRSENRTELMTFLTKPEGAFKQSLTFEINYIDLGLSLNAANKTYEDYQAKKSLPMSRGSVATDPFILAFYKMGLTHDVGFLETRLGNSLKFLQVSSKDGPVKDKWEFTLDLRMPLDRTVWKDNETLSVSPILKNKFETRLGPLTFLGPKSANEWTSEKKLPRKKKLDTLVGTEVDFKKAGFQIELGGLMSTNFNANSLVNALDFGPGLNFYSAWDLYGPLALTSDISTSYLFGLPKHTMKNKQALAIEGTVWLRVARYKDFSLNFVTDLLLASLQEAPQKVAASSIFGITISYGHFFRLFG